MVVSVPSRFIAGQRSGFRKSLRDKSNDDSKNRVRFFLIREFRLADAVIAATCLEHNLTLITYNVRDFGL
jgi:predicted nucleic acid-binding protein